MPTAFINLWVCLCCMLAQAADGCGECSHEREPLSAIPDGYHLTMGLLAEEHAEGCEVRIQGRAPVNYECDCDRDSFSTAQCDGCGTWLHGERHAMAMWPI